MEQRNGTDTKSVVSKAAMLAGGAVILLMFGRVLLRGQRLV